MSNQEIKEALALIGDADTSTANYHLLEHEQKKALARIENRAPEWLRAQQDFIEYQAEQMESIIRGNEEVKRLNGLAYEDLRKEKNDLLAIVDQQAQEIKQKAEIIDGLANERHDLINECDALKDTIFDLNFSLNLAIKALERIEDYWEANITVKTYARDALDQIRRVET